MVAFLLVTNEAILQTFGDYQPSFIADTATLLEKRGHANLPLPLPKKDIARLRKQALSIIKALFEV